MSELESRRAARLQKEFTGTNQTVDTLRGETIKNHRNLSELAYDTEARARNFNNMSNVEHERMSAIFSKSMLVIGVMIVVLFMFIWNTTGKLKWRLLFTLIACVLLACVLMVIQTNVERSFDVLRDNAEQLIFMMRYACAAKRSSDSQLMNALLGDVRAIRGRSGALSDSLNAMENNSK